MNTVVKRKLSSVIAGESIVQNIGQGKSKNLCKTIYQNHNNKGNHTGNHNGHQSININVDKKINDKKQTNKKHHNEDCIESAYKRQKKTHYNDKMEPIRLSSSSTNTNTSTINKLVSGSLKVGVDTGCLPKRIREVVWSTYNGETYSSPCYVPWCHNMINVFNYQVGHDIPESKGGTYDIGNLRPICINCNLSMGNKWTIQEWGKLVNPDKQCNEQSEKEQHQHEQSEKEQNNITDLQVITPETTSRITLFTLLFLAFNFMIF